VQNCLRGRAATAKMRGMFRTEDYLDLKQFAFPELFDDCQQVWDALKKLSEFAGKRVKPAQRGKVVGSPFIGPDVMIGEGTVVEHGAVIKGPAIIGANCEIRASAYIRGGVIAGDGCVLGNACEFKNAVLFNGVQVPHFSYVGDSILGYKAHLGAGVILSNFKSTKGNVVVRTAKSEERRAKGEEQIDTGLRKFGAIIGDGADIGCNCVLSPGSIIGRGAILYPNIFWRGVCPADSIVKLRQQHRVVTRK
jgi:UDP-N-acetylglucosamine diphosphorylase / glucose-1-phosphate thymidylyltransferase / UDP-N-acetylgalactosamine diphosphorylase / glucosamine-1-phosphate N-acetyltransferase / galactosamine-1-phosphate N-acetyltransferase